MTSVNPWFPSRIGNHRLLFICWISIAKIKHIFWLSVKSLLINSLLITYCFLFVKVENKQYIYFGKNQRQRLLKAFCNGLWMLSYSSILRQHRSMQHTLEHCKRSFTNFLYVAKGNFCYSSKQVSNVFIF